MQKATKKFDECIETINRIKNPIRRKGNQAARLNTNQVSQLPVIANTLMSFHKEERLSVKFDNIYSHRSNNKVQTELDAIISGALMTYKNQKINKIIFASPINNRLSLGKTYYRTSRFASLDAPVSHRSEETGSRKVREEQDLTTLKQTQGNNFTHLNLSSQLSHSSNQEVLDLSPTLKTDHNSNSDDFSLFYTASARTPAPQRKMRRSYIRPLANRKKQEQKEVRYSPWRNQEGDDQLLI